MSAPDRDARPLVDDSPIGRSAFPDAPPDLVVRLALGAIRALRRLTDAITPAELAVFERSVGAARTAMLGAVARLGVADALLDGPLGTADLAARVGAHEDALYRTLRALAHDGFFRLRGDGRWENSRLSAALRGGTLARSRQWVLYWSSRSNLDAWGALDHVLRTGGGGFAHANGAGVWDWFAAHPDEERCFAEAMMGLTSMTAPFVAARYPFAEVQTVCDVGGGRGTLLSEILLRHPHLRGTLADAEGVAPLAGELFARRGVEARARFEVGDFFARVPEGSELYTLKNILHDWDDARCAKILSTVRAAMRPGARVLIIESFLERDDVDSPAALADMQMMVVCDGGRERSRAELRALLEGAGFRAGREWPTATDSMIEGVAV